MAFSEKLNFTIYSSQDSEFRAFFGRIEDTIICFRDSPTFSEKKSDFCMGHEEIFYVFTNIFDNFDLNIYSLKLQRNRQNVVC